MRDYWLTQEILKFTGFAFIAVSLMGIGLAIWLPKKWWGKLFALCVVAFAISIPVRMGTREIQEQQVKNDEFKEHLEIVKTIFEERCKKAGEKIYRTVENVDGIILLKLRPTHYSPEDQNAIDPYGYDFDWDSDGKPPPYISTFLVGKDKNGIYQESVDINMPGTSLTQIPGYSYVEALDIENGRRYRYTGQLVEPWQTNKHYLQGYFIFLVDKVPAAGSPPRYGVTYDDISTPEERGQWIAGSSLKVIDLQANEVIAERIGYMVDFGHGSQAGFRQPWTFARINKGWSCPALNNQSYGARRFVEKVLHISDAKQK